MIPRKFAFIHEQRSRTLWPVRLMCRVLAVSVSGFYDFVKRLDKPGPREQRRAELAPRIAEIHGTSRQTYGSPRVCRQLRLEGETVSEKTVARVMKDLDIQGKSPRKRRPITTDSDHDRPIADNVLARNFTASGPNQKWAADITYIDTDEGWLYLAVVLDLFSRRVVGWATADHMRADLVCDATRAALLQRRPGGDLIHHSDRGSQYASGDFQQLLEQHGIVCSMSRRANCWDNAVSESFFGTLKTELDAPMTTRQSAHTNLFDYIEVFYNRQRLHSTLNYTTPAAYEQMHHAA